VANAAPFIASPVKRFVAGTLDVALYSICLTLVVAVVTSMGDSRGFGMPLVAAAASVTYALYHLVFFWFLAGATPGLRAFDMQLVRASDGGDLSVVQVLVRAGFRPLLLWLFGWSVDLLAAPSIRVEAVLPVPLLLELGMMFTLPSRQTLSDLVSNTLVVNVPPPQPHRAPAAPMYSPADAEFGLPPRRKR
jgi:uncharacterized RDD family membrane protein YckC